MKLDTLLEFRPVAKSPPRTRDPKRVHPMQVGVALTDDNKYHPLEIVGAQVVETIVWAFDNAVNHNIGFSGRARFPDFLIYRY